MKIYRFPNHSGPEGYRKNSYHSPRQAREYLKPAAGGEDMVIISPEAREKFNKDNLVKIDRFLAKKQAESIKDAVMEKIRMDMLSREHSANKTIEKIKSEKLIFSIESLEESAELLNIFYSFKI